jgi:hypothetical protein
MPRLWSVYIEIAEREINLRGERIAVRETKVGARGAAPCNSKKRY